MATIAARIKVGDKLPINSALKIMGKDGMTDIKIGEIFGAQKRGILFAVPGAFTPTCSNKHLPNFVENADKIREKHRLDVIACISVNDAFVMSAWGQQQNADKAGIMMLADGNCDFTKIIGLDKDASGAGMGQRSHRYAMFIEDQVVKHLGVDDKPGQLENSAVEAFMGDAKF